MSKLVLSLKREYWEYRRVVLGIPIMLSILVIIASAMVTLYKTNDDGVSKLEQGQTLQTDRAAEKNLASQEPHEGTEKAKPLLNKEQLQLRTPFRFMAIYMAVAWFAALFYLLSSLYSDRKDKSILYWKSLPVSETQNVLSKFFFGSVVFALAAIVIGWLVYLFLYVFGFGAVNSPDAGDTWEYVERTFDFTRLFLWPLTAMLVGVLWGAPFFSFALLVSAVSKRMRFMTMLLPLLVIAALERIVFSSSVLIDFFTSHFPFAVVANLSDDASIIPTLNLFFVEKASSLIVGLVLSAVFLAEAIWYRNKRFEI